MYKANILKESDMKTELPNEIKQQMDMWRLGFGTMPKEYIQFHKDLAEKASKDLEDQGYLILDSKIAGDGWMDGMKVLHLTVAYQGEEMRLHWHDGSQTFFLKHDEGGSSPLSLNA